MERLEPLDSAETLDLEEVFHMETLDLEEVFHIKSDTLGFVPNSALTIARWPELAREYGQLSQAVTTWRHFTGELASWIFLTTSTAAGCQYCQAHSAGTALSRAISKAKLEEVWKFEKSKLFTQGERAALRFAIRSGFSPSQVTDEHFGQAKTVLPRGGDRRNGWDHRVQRLHESVECSNGDRNRKLTQSSGQRRARSPRVVCRCLRSSFTVIDRTHDRLEAPRDSQPNRRT